MTAIAAIDVGSNAVRLAVGYYDQHGKLTVSAEHREAVRLGGDVFGTGEISESTLVLAEQAFRRFRQVLDSYQVKTVRAVGTSALREARNRDAFQKRMLAVSGIEVQVISGQEEARLIHLAVRKALNLDRQLALLIDIGGGSVEISLVKRGNVIYSDSVKMGAVRLLQLLDGRQRIQKIFDRLVRGYVKGLRRRLKKDLRGQEIEVCVGTGGNFEEMGELRCKILGKDDKSHFLLKELDKIINRVEDLSVDERIRKLNMRPDRADVIVPAAILTQEIMRQVRVKKALIPHVGLKNGLLWDFYSRRKASKSPSLARQQAIAFAHQIGKRYSFDEAHAVCVAKHAAKLFDDLAAMTKLSQSDRLLLEIAALLHDIGHYVNSNGHHKHSCYLIRASMFVGLSEQEKNVVACVARYHRKSGPKLEHPEFAAFGENERNLVKKLSALLRIADAMDASHQNGVRNFSLKRGRDLVELTLRGHGDLMLERWSIGSKSKLFEDVFNLKFKVVE